MILTSEVVWFERSTEKERSLELKRGIGELESMWKRISDYITD